MAGCRTIRIFHGQDRNVALVTAAQKCRAKRSSHHLGWEAGDHVRADLHQGYRPPLLQHRLQEGRHRHEPRILPDLASDDVADTFWCVLWVCKASELSPDELERLMTVVANPEQFKVPDWFLNMKKDYKDDGRFSQVVSNALDMKLRDDLERLKKIRQHTKTRGKTVGVSKKR
uniref:Uncharacterized protein n=1 Tax=Setaria viridis TaxID=4556 RepID=A0A4U6SRU3_SETVI|nr:hypothetical protein SEVIR_9G057000v2 [Setaria viridis]